MRPSLKYLSDQEVKRVHEKALEMLEDLVLSAVNEAIRQADEMYNNAMGKLTGGMGGMF